MGKPCIWASDIIATRYHVNECNMNHYNMIYKQKLIGNGYRIFF